MRLSEKFGFLADPGFFFHRIAPKLVANILVNINSGVLGVLLMIFFGNTICVQPNNRICFGDSEYGVGILCDLSRAFDTLDHEILLLKLNHYGIRGPILAWISSYLSGRKQYVDLNSTESSCLDITVGVPQGSILGPLLFLLYINDLPSALEKLRPIMFADDTNLVMTGKNLDRLRLDVQSDLNELADYFRANKLKLNIDKTKLICFRKKGTEIEKKHFEICLDGKHLDMVDSARFLGMTIDCHLMWEKQCQEVANKASRTTGILGRLKNFLPKTALKIIYDSLFMSHVQYGLEVWGGTTTSKGMKRLVGLQKKAIRHISKAHYVAHTEPRMKNLGFLKIADQHLFQCAKLAHDIVNNHSPASLQNSLNLCAESRTYSLRSISNNPTELKESQMRKREVKLGFSTLAPKIWNKIPENIRKIKNRYGFKKQLKQHILDGYAEKLSCSNPLCNDKKFHLH